MTAEDTCVEISYVLLRLITRFASVAIDPAPCVHPVSTRHSRENR